MAGSDHSRAISTDHLVRIGHENRKDDPSQGKDQESNLQNGPSSRIFHS